LDEAVTPDARVDSQRLARWLDSHVFEAKRVEDSFVGRAAAILPRAEQSFRCDLFQMHVRAAALQDDDVSDFESQDIHCHCHSIINADITFARTATTARIIRVATIEPPWDQGKTAQASEKRLRQQPRPETAEKQVMAAGEVYRTFLAGTLREQPMGAALTAPGRSDGSLATANV